MLKLTLIPHFLGTCSLLMLTPRNEYELALLILYSTFILPLVLGWNNPVFTYLKSSTHNILCRFIVAGFMIFNYYIIRKAQLNF